MTIAATGNRAEYSGNSSTTVFSFPYPFSVNADLKVIQKVTSTGVETTKTETTDYTVTGAGTGSGTITMLVAPPTGTKLIIYRDPAQLQELDLVENDPLPVEELEKALDRLTLMAQRLKDQVARSLRTSEGTISTFDGKLPQLLVANKALIINATADGIALGPDADQIENAQQAADDAQQAADDAAQALADLVAGAVLDNSVTTAKIADGAVTTVKIADSNVTTAKLADGSVTTVKIADANVTTAKIADSNVTTAKINANAVTKAKLSAWTDNGNDAAVSDATITSTTYVDIASLSVVCTGRPVMVFLNAGTAGSLSSVNLTSTGSNNAVADFRVTFAGNDAGSFRLYTGQPSPDKAAWIQIPPAAIKFMIVSPPGLGATTFKIQAKVGDANSTLTLLNLRVVAFEV